MTSTKEPVFRANCSFQTAKDCGPNVAGDQFQSFITMLDLHQSDNGPRQKARSTKTRFGMNWNPFCEPPKTSVHPQECSCVCSRVPPSGEPTKDKLRPIQQRYDDIFWFLALTLPNISEDFNLILLFIRLVPQVCTWRLDQANWMCSLMPCKK